MARYARMVDIAAPPEAVWSVLADVDKWPAWTPTILSVVRLESGAFGLGSSAKVKAKGFAESVLRVTEWTPGRSFTWEGPAGPGMRILLGHVIEATDGGSRVTLSIDPAGPLAMFIGWLAARMARGNLNVEAERLKARVEGIAA